MNSTTPATPHVTLTTDGSSLGNPGPGGWAVLLEHGERHKLLSGGVPQRTTNNNMEVRAVLEGITALKQPCHIRLRTDSQYVIYGLERIVAGRALLKTNRELWQQLAAALAPHTIEWQWIQGHNGDARNEQVDRAAVAAAQDAARSR